MKTKLKDSTFAIIAEEKDSISHKWFNETDGNINDFEWGCKYYIKQGSELWGQDSKPKNIPIYTESEFEAILKVEQENKAKETKFKPCGYALCNCESESECGYVKGGVKEVFMASQEQITQLTAKPLNEPKQVTFTYQTAIDLLAYYTKIDKGIIKIEMP